MGSQYREAQDQYEFTKDISTNTFENMARSMGVIINQVAIVASYDPSSKMATVFFPSDMETESNSYKNITGESLSVGEKVYVFYRYGDVEQGWIMAK